MKIKELPQELQELAMLRAKEHCDRLGDDFDKYSTEDSLSAAFSWRATPEDYDYWNGINEGSSLELNVMSDSQASIAATMDEIKELLLSKNKAYGNSALEPINIFSKETAIDSLSARIDDKLARIKNVGLNDSTEDTLKDLIGYMVLLLIARRNGKV
jgi:hypothetical protein